jgi:hypothetical protein
MAYFPVIQKHSRALSAAHHRPLPDFYMADFSILGFRVSDCDRAIQILNQHHFPLKRIHDGVEVGVDGPGQIQEAVRLLKGGGLDCDIADVAEGLYQG